jgi:hypothetical protein
VKPSRPNNRRNSAVVSFQFERAPAPWNSADDYASAES